MALTQEKIRVSIITATYNSGNTLTDTVLSVLSQSYSNVEYIIVDGGSQDNTIEIIKMFECRFNGNLKCISETDRGLYDAMNKGIQLATGDIIGVLNSDDFYTSQTVLSRVVAEFENKSLDAVYGDVHFVKADNLNKFVRYYSSRIFKPVLMKYGFMPAHPSFYCRKYCFFKYGLYKIDYKICADFDLLLRYIYVNKISIKYIPLDMVTMRLGGVSTNGIGSHIRIMKEHLRSFRENGVKSNVFMLSIRYLYKITEFFIK